MGQPENIGPYELRGELGRGGMGVVYRGYDTRLDREVAIKLLSPALLTDAAARERFVTEARAVAKLNHPHILPIYDVGDDAAGCYMVMRLAGDEDLAAKLTARGRLAHDESLALLRQLAGALDTAHALGVVHRDIKPENVLLDNGHALLADFGLARICEGAGRGLTQTGMILGTPEYMSPEQAGGTSIDHRSDLYSFGILAYRLLTGVVPFAGTSAVAVAIRHVKEPPPDPRLVAPELTAAQASVLLRMLAKEPRQRFESATAFVDALAAAGQPGAVPLETKFLPAPSIPGLPAPAAAHAARQETARSLLRGMLPAIIVLGFAAGCGLAWLGTHPRTVEVPQLVGWSRQTAEAQVASLGLTAAVDEQPDAGPPNRVVGQLPAAGPVAPGSTVHLRVSRPLPSQPVPQRDPGWLEPQLPPESEFEPEPLPEPEPTHKVQTIAVGGSFERPLGWSMNEKNISSDGYHARRWIWQSPDDKDLQLAVEASPMPPGSTGGWRDLDARFRGSYGGRYTCHLLDDVEQHGALLERWEYTLTTRSGKTKRTYKLGGWHNGYGVSIWGTCLASDWSRWEALIRRAVDSYRQDG